MSNKILPITALRDTAKIDEEIHKSSDPIFVTKNGYGDFVLVSQEYFDSHFLTPSTKVPIA
jgi:PHD/YefM family antitoxin component YafN of YafNO toxin-antitoxin module